MIEKLEEIAKLQAEAIKNIKLIKLRCGMEVLI